MEKTSYGFQIGAEYFEIKYSRVYELLVEIHKALKRISEAEKWTNDDRKGKTKSGENSIVKTFIFNTKEQELLKEISQKVKKVCEIGAENQGLLKFGYFSCNTDYYEINDYADSMKELKVDKTDEVFYFLKYVAWPGSIAITDKGVYVRSGTINKFFSWFQFADISIGFNEKFSFYIDYYQIKTMGGTKFVYELLKNIQNTLSVFRNRLSNIWIEDIHNDYCYAYDKKDNSFKLRLFDNEVFESPVGFISVFIRAIGGDVCAQESIYDALYKYRINRDSNRDIADSIYKIIIEIERIIDDELCEKNDFCRFLSFIVDDLYGELAEEQKKEMILEFDRRGVAVVYRYLADSIDYDDTSRESLLNRAVELGSVEAVCILKNNSGTYNYLAWNIRDREKYYRTLIDYLKKENGRISYVNKPLMVYKQRLWGQNKITEYLSYVIDNTACIYEPLKKLINKGKIKIEINNSNIFVENKDECFYSNWRWDAFLKTNDFDIKLPIGEYPLIKFDVSNDKIIFTNIGIYFVSKNSFVRYGYYDGEYPQSCIELQESNGYCYAIRCLSRYISNELFINDREEYRRLNALFLPNFDLGLVKEIREATSIFNIFENNGHELYEEEVIKCINQKSFKRAVELIDLHIELYDEEKQLMYFLIAALLRIEFFDDEFEYGKLIIRKFIDNTYRVGLIRKMSDNRSVYRLVAEGYYRIGNYIENESKVRNVVLDYEEILKCYHTAAVLGHRKAIVRMADLCKDNLSGVIEPSCFYGWIDFESEGTEYDDMQIFLQNICGEDKVKEDHTKKSSQTLQEYLLSVSEEYRRLFGSWDSAELDRLKKCFGNPEFNTVYIAYDATISKSGKNGFLLTDKGFICRRPYEKYTNITSFYEIYNCKTISISFGNIYCDDKVVVSVTGEKSRVTYLKIVIEMIKNSDFLDKKLVNKNLKKSYNKCMYCNHEIYEDARFCTFCGKPIEDTKICPNCGKNIPSYVKFCNFCGNKF